MALKANDPADDVLAAIGSGDRLPADESRDLSAGDDVLAAIGKPTPIDSSKNKIGVVGKLRDLAARGAHIPGGGKTLETFTEGVNDLTNAVTTGGIDLFGRLATGNRHPINPKYFQGKPQPAGKILQEEYGWSPWAAQPVGLVAGAVADPTGRVTEGFDPIAQGLDKLSSKVYQTGFRNVSRVFPRLKQHATNDAGEEFIEFLRQNKVLKGGSDARSVEKQLRSWQRNTLGSKMDELELPIKDKVYNDVNEVLKPYSEFRKEAMKDAGPEAIVQSFEDKLLGPELLKIKDAGGFTVGDLRRKGKFYSSMASGKKGAQGDLYKQFARESEGKRAASEVSRGMSDFRRNRVTEANPEVGPPIEGGKNVSADEINKTYSLYGNVETAKPALRKMAEVEQGKTWTNIDSMLAASAAMGEAVGGHGTGLIPLGLLLAKKGNNYLKSTAGATRVGNLLQSAGETNIWDKMVKRGLLQAGDKGK